MHKEIITYLGRKLEVVVNEQETILFAKETKPVYQYHVGDVEMNRVSGYGLLTSINDVGFVPGLNEHDLPLRGIVDYQYIDAEPLQQFSDAHVGNVVIKDADTNKVYLALAFQGSAMQKQVAHGETVGSNSEGIMMSAPSLLKEVVGKNLNEIKENRMHR